uniref:Uncharacterized protein n=1 Tax=Anguilla anguilla TaxID=7936 RepID=A0A0E9WCB4_ANGAN
MHLNYKYQKCSINITNIHVFAEVEPALNWINVTGRLIYRICTNILTSCSTQH